MQLCVYNGKMTFSRNPFQTFSTANYPAAVVFKELDLGYQEEIKQRDVLT